MNKWQRILRLNNGKRTSREIAALVGCSATYVRYVLAHAERQRAAALARWLFPKLYERCERREVEA